MPFDPPLQLVVLRPSYMFFLVIFGWYESKIYLSSANLIHRKKIDFIKFLIVHRKIITLPSIVSPSAILQGDIMISCIKFKNSTTSGDPSSFALHTPNLTIIIFDHQVITLFSSIRAKNRITKLEKSGDNRRFTDLPYCIGHTFAFSFTNQSHLRLHFCYLTTYCFIRNDYNLTAFICQYKVSK